MRQKISTYLLLTAVLAVGLIATIAVAKEKKKEAPKQILFTNVKIFNGVDNKLINADVLVENNLIKKVAKGIKAYGATVINGGGRTLMPGLIDGHAHVMINGDYGELERDMDIIDIGIRSTIVMERFLMDGFTAVRDMGGPTFGLQRNIDKGIINGPRLYASGAFISQTSGHGDFRDRADPGFTHNVSGDLSNFERYGFGTVADGVPEVLKATRLNLRNGATQIKIMAGGGGSSRFDPMDTTQYSFKRGSVCHR
jgi:imidazolonepropionase-like amidohydrolase